MAVSKKKKRKRKPQKHTFFRSLFKGVRSSVIAINRYTTRVEEREVQREYRLFGRKITFWGFTSIILVILVIIIFAMNDRSVSTDQSSVVVTGLPDDFEGYRILHISDLAGKTFGQDQSALSRIIGNLSYDMVLFTGDMVGESGNAEPFYSLIEILSKKKPIYFIAGDNDPAPLLSEARDNSAGNLTLNQMVLNDWVLGAIERGAIYLDSPKYVTKGSSKLWLIPDMLLNLNLSETMDSLKQAMEQESESMLLGIEESRASLPFTNYRYNIINKAHSNLALYTPQDMIIMLSHEIPTDSQLLVSQEPLSVSEAKSYYPSPDMVFAGHYCGGEWKIPGLGAIHIPARLSARYGWFPEETLVQGKRTIGSTIAYITPGLSTSGDTLFGFRLMNPPQISLITLTGELPTSFLD